MAIRKDCRPLFFSGVLVVIFLLAFSTCFFLQILIVFFYCFIPKDKGRMRRRDKDFLLAFLFSLIEISSFLYNFLLAYTTKLKTK